MAHSRLRKKHISRSSGRQLARTWGAVLTIASLGLLTACNNTPQALENPSRVLQSVNVELASNASIAEVKGTAVAVDDVTGESSTTTDSYSPADVASDLPVRVSTSYRTADGTGTDLKDLQGYTGRVEIELTVQNLTVESRDVTFDVAGQSRTEPALVGAPMTIAASTEIPGLEPNSIISSTDDSSASGTNGIVSASPEGNTVIQWATLLAPPVSPATTTLRLVANVEDFAAPGIDVAVQPGMHTDLTVNGVLDSAFNESTTSDLALQRRTIDLVTDVNEVLNRAGATITEVRTNLESTSDTLGVSTARHLKDSSESLAGTLGGLKEQLGQLENDLGATVTAADSATNSQLMQTVSVMEGMLGDTTASIPTPRLNGRGCAAIVEPTGEASSVYSNLKLISAQLNGYAEATASCRDELTAAMQKTLGPAQPAAANCTEPSLTCAFRASSITVTSELINLALEGDKLVASLKPEVVANSLARQESMSASLNELSEKLDHLSSEEIAASITALRESAEKARKSLDSVHDRVDSIHSLAQKNAALIGSAKESYSMAGQNAELAREICALANQGRIRAEDAQQLHGYLTDAKCVVKEQVPATKSPKPTEEPKDDPSASATPTDEPSGEATTPSEPTADPTESAIKPTDRTTDPIESEAPADEPSTGPTGPIAEPASYTLPSPSPLPHIPEQKPMDERLQGQAEAWDTVAGLTDLEQTETGLGRLLEESGRQLEKISKQIDELEQIAVSDSGSMQTAIDNLHASLGQARGTNEDLGKGLAELELQQAQLEARIKQAFGEASRNSADKVNELVNGQVRVLAEHGNSSREAVVEAFNRSLTGLTGTAGQVSADAKVSVDKQHAELGKHADALSGAISEQTAVSLEQIAASTEASTRDVEGADGLLAASLGKVLLDLGDRKVNGSGLLGALSTSAAMSDTADYQLALATKNAEGYANVRAEDIAAILHRQAQFKASVQAAGSLPAFHLEVPEGATARTLYAFHIGAGR